MLCEQVVAGAEEDGRRRCGDGRSRGWRLRLRHGVVDAEEREREIRVRVCVGKETMTWQTLIDDLS